MFQNEDSRSMLNQKVSLYFFVHFWIENFIDVYFFWNTYTVLFEEKNYEIFIAENCNNIASTKN